MLPGYRRGTRAECERLNSSDRTRRRLHYCDGCGWCEGGEALKTECETCGGTGVLVREKMENG